MQDLVVFEFKSSSFMIRQCSWVLEYHLGKMCLPAVGDSFALEFSLLVSRSEVHRHCKVFLHRRDLSAILEFLHDYSCGIDLVELLSASSVSIAKSADKDARYNSLLVSCFRYAQLCPCPFGRYSTTPSRLEQCRSLFPCRFLSFVSVRQGYSPALLVHCESLKGWIVRSLLLGASHHRN